MASIITFLKNCSLLTRLSKKRFVGLFEPNRKLSAFKMTKDLFVLLETLYLHPLLHWPRSSRFACFSRYETSCYPFTCSSLDALRVTGKQWSFYRNKGLAWTCHGAWITFSSPRIQQIKVGVHCQRLWLTGGSAWKKGGLSLHWSVSLLCLPCC